MSNLSKDHSIFPYFGAKSKVVKLYPAPEYRTLIEPFAGGASYSLHHYECDVWLNDLYGPTVSVWRFLTSPDALRIINDRVPFEVKAGQTIDELTRPDDPEGLVNLMRAQFAQSSFGMNTKRTRVAPFGAAAWNGKKGGMGFRKRLNWWVPRIAHWKVTQMSYEQLPNQDACWFIDPPYNCDAGRTYAKSAKDINFEHLGEWCKSREGQVIVCEGPAATWLPFKPLHVDQTHEDAGTAKRRGIYSDDIKSTDGEVVYLQYGERKTGLWAE